MSDPVSESAMANKPLASHPGVAGRGSDAVLSRALELARAAILWERLWPALAAPATAVGLFLAVSWLGVWLWLPPSGHAIGLCLFFLLAAAATLPLLRLRFPTREDALRRLDCKSGLPHRPATTIADDISGITHHVHILQMNGDSYRLNQSKRRSRRASPDTPTDNPTQA